MSTDELLDAHAERLRTDPGYLEIWNRVQAEKPEHRMLLAMHLWGTQAATLRTLCGVYALAAEGPAGGGLRESC